MDKTTGKIIIFLGIIFVFFLGSNFALALEVRYPVIPGLTPINDTSTLPEYVCYLFGLITNLAIFIAVISIAFGGVYYLISYGRGKFTSEGKDWIKAGILGLLIVVCASLIAYTINPDLTTCKLGILAPILSQISQGPGPTSSNVPTVTYDEVPMGILMENALTKTIDCYGFDSGGNPIEGDPIKNDSGDKINAPTYMGHDRVDCVAQLFDGAQKKAQSSNELSKEIKKLMNTCSCEGKCDPPLLFDALGACGLPPDCNGPSSKCQPTAACTNPIGKVGANGFPMNGDCCADGVKQKIEHGMVNVGGDPAESDLPLHQYNGLDEFRCPNPKNPAAPCSGIIGFVEASEQINKKTVKIIQKEKWDGLNLLQQLTYFKEKLDEIKQQELQPDKNKLNQAKTKLATGNCYMASSYVDLLKTYEGTDKQQTVILTNKIFTGSDGKKIDAAKYCTGFNYGNSSCLQKCNDACPDTSGPAIQCYQSCNGESVEKKPDCIKKCYTSRPCTYSDNQNTSEAPPDFNSCISSCQSSCSDDCLKKYPQTSNEYDACKSQCDDNSQCVLNNSKDCLLNAQRVTDCATQATAGDPGSTNYCINNAYLCKSGSDEYAGYQDCISPSATNCPSLNANGCKDSPKCTWDGKKCLQNYSASFIYDDKINSNWDYVDYIKCPYAFTPASKGTACYNPKNPNASCQEVCPETSKCPAASNCPNCPCDQIDNKTFEFTIPTQTRLGASSCLENAADPHAGDSTNVTLSENVSAYMITGPQCTGYSFNDDPLTYYCEQNWLQDPNREGLDTTPIGAERVCPTSGEVPVGQTFDSVNAWLSDLISTIGKESQDIQNMANFLKQKVGDAWTTKPVDKYCTCEAKYENKDPVCTTSCDLFINPFSLVPSCVAVPCAGNSCQQMIDYVSKVSDYYRTLKLSFIDFNLSGISDSYGRSDIMKKLTYSRQKTNDCSLQSSAFGSQVRLLSCTRVEREIISPVNDGPIKINDKDVNSCYGGWAGKIWGLTDNQFCCQAQIEVPTPVKGQSQ